MTNDARRKPQPRLRAAGWSPIRWPWEAAAERRARRLQAAYAEAERRQRED